MSNPDIECRDCDGWGTRLLPGCLDDAAPCPACSGTGWRPMTDDELDTAAERQAEDRAEASHDGGGPLSLDEQHRAAWHQKQAARR